MAKKKKKKGAPEAMKQVTAELGRKEKGILSLRSEGSHGWRQWSEIQDGS